MSKRLLVSALAVCLVVAAFAIGAWVSRHELEERLTGTHERLDSLASLIRRRGPEAFDFNTADAEFDKSVAWPPHADERSGNGLAVLAEQYGRRAKGSASYADGVFKIESLGWVSRRPGEDAWGHSFLYRCPGPVHRHGWDLYSVGPDGVDEHGEGDDILVGEDVGSVSSSP